MCFVRDKFVCVLFIIIVCVLFNWVIEMLLLMVFLVVLDVMLLFGLWRGESVVILFFIYNRVLVILLNLFDFGLILLFD